MNMAQHIYKDCNFVDASFEQNRMQCLYQNYTFGVHNRMEHNISKSLVELLHLEVRMEMQLEEMSLVA
jgi:hypothetical protein